MLVGSTGFVGSNIRSQFKFDYLFNSKNITDSYGLKPDLLVYAGVSAKMFLANQYPEQDMSIIAEAIENIYRIAPQKVILISTTAVYQKLENQIESSIIPIKGLSPYGRNRYFLECWVSDNFKEHLILRLPALFGQNLKKNFIYDYINIIPSLLKTEKYWELAEKSALIKHSYQKKDSDFFTCISGDKREREQLKSEFMKTGFSALNFTDDRSIYQFYNLSHLWEHILVCLKKNIKKINLVTEPIKISELYYYLTGTTFYNHLSESPYHYNIRSDYAEDFGGVNGYLYQKEFVLKEIKEFINNYYA